jgi:hypothetical protein
MFCPNCGNKTSEEQRFCRSCGLALEKIAQSLSEQLPTEFEASLQERKARLERLGVAALSVFGVGVLGFILYGLFYKLMLAKGALVAGLALLGAIVFIGSGLLSVILFAKAKELTDASQKRKLVGASEINSASTHQLASQQPQPIFGVTDRTTELLPVDKTEKVPPA